MMAVPFVNPRMTIIAAAGVICVSGNNFDKILLNQCGYNIFLYFCKCLLRVSQSDKYNLDNWIFASRDIFDCAARQYR